MFLQKLRRFFLPSELAPNVTDDTWHPAKRNNDTSRIKIRISKNHRNYVVGVKNSQQRGYQDQHPHAVSK